MHTITIKVSDNAYNRFISQMKDYDKNDIQIIESQEEYLETKKQLHLDRQRILEGKATFHTMEEFEEELEKVIQKYGN